ncbi:hypothetical protein PV10_01433 [Exophiala mesophila]|uniref:Arrestin-like N-terminal domain-containing protein n=1 Tax=Exophiala mesophila TaxID=212818 RepID=A0A0D1X793_EXOME|nr:uncharacterized protein PV10_01433 [Exophiala mesophila]KIV97720.1 hypothetical protein PV10_01433 [Exophiala mesophila]
MGLTKTENSPGLSFDIQNPRQVYSPGDVIRGQVVLNTAEDSAIGKIAVNLWGRTKSRIIQQHGQAVTYHRGRTTLFDLEQVLYEGQYTHKPGTFSWPFEFIIPSQADPTSVLAGDKWKPKDHFSGTTTADEDGLNLVLPPSNHHSRIMFGRQAECFVEYVLSTTLTEPEGLHKIRKPQSKTSTLPLTFHPLSTPEPIQDWGLIEDSRLITISTLKLLPEHAGTSLGLRDRARSLFHRDSIPKYSFTLKVEAPTTIQLLHPTPIPFLITLTPDQTPENTTVDTSTGFPRVVLRNASIQLKTHVRCRAAGTYSERKTYELPILAKKSLDQPLSPSLKLDSDTDTRLDLGALCDLRLGNANLGSKLETPLCPSFNTFNVAREYFLTWDLEVECAEKVEKFSSKKNGDPTTVILPAGTTQSSFPSSGVGNDYLGADLAHATSVTSSSNGLWNRRRVSGEDAMSAMPTGSSRGEKEKPGFTPTSTALASGNSPLTSSLTGGDKTKTKTKEKLTKTSLPPYVDHSSLAAPSGQQQQHSKSSKSKDQEAAEDRARARARDEDVPPAITFQNPHEIPFRSTDMDETRSPHGGQDPDASTAVPNPRQDDGNQLPKYVP